MALHTELPIYKTGVDLLSLAVKVQEQMPRALHTALHRIEHLADGELYATINSYFGLLRQASHSHADRSRLGRAVLRRDYCVSGDLTKTFKRGNQA